MRQNRYIKKIFFRIMDKKKRIVITGIGIISPIGIGKDRYWEGLQAGKLGFKPITLFSTSDLKVKFGGEITEFDAKNFLGQRISKNLDRATRLLSSATKLALDDSSLQIDDKNAKEIGIVAGSTFGSVQSIMDFDKKALTDGPLSVNPSHFSNTVINSPASQAAIRFGIKGFNATISTGMCASLDALDYGVDFIGLNRAKMVIVGSVEEMCLQTFLGFYKLKYLSGSNGQPEVHSCPFDKRRNGIVFSEGSAVLILEDIETAQMRKTPIYAEVLGIGSCFDPYSIRKYNPKGIGMKQAMRMALDEASLKPQDIDCIFANANSTEDADLIETEAIKEVFGEYANKIPVTAIKSMVGETFSASGSLAVIAALGSFNQNFIPPTTDYQKKDQKCDLDYVPNKIRRQKVDKVMINSFSPTGHNTVLIMARAD